MTGLEAGAVESVDGGDGETGPKTGAFESVDGRVCNDIQLLNG